MAQINSFYVHLPINHKIPLWLNSAHTHTSHLSQALHLDGEWEVALTEISYTVSWYNLVGESFCSILTFGHDLEGSEKFGKGFVGLDTLQGESEEDMRVEEEQQISRGEGVSSYDGTTITNSLDGVITSTPLKEPKNSNVEEMLYMNFPIPKLNHTFSDSKLAIHTESDILYKTRIRRGHYTARELIDYINLTVLHELISREPAGSYINPPQLELGKDGYVSSLTGRRQNLETKKAEDTFLNVTGDAAAFLGFYWDRREEWVAVNTNLGRKYRMTSSNHIDTRGGIYNMYVYSDVIRSVHVGDTMSNLLRIVEIPNTTSLGEQVNVSHIKPQYKRVASNEISTISIYIKDNNGDNIAFRFGTTIVTLHFRKVNS